MGARSKHQAGSGRGRVFALLKKTPNMSVADLAAKAGIKKTTARNYQMQFFRVKPPDIIDVPTKKLPFETSIGTMYHRPIAPPPPGGFGGCCARCSHLAECRQRSAEGDFVLCERVILVDICQPEKEEEGKKKNSE